MGENNADDIQKDDIEEGDDEDTATDDESEESDSKKDDDKSSDDDADEGDGKSDEDEPDDADKDDDKEDDDEDNEEDEPPTRKPKTAADFVAERRGRKIAKLQGKGKSDQGKSDKKGEDADEGEEDEDGLAPEDAAAIDKRVGKIIAPILQKEEQKEVETQIAAFIQTNPDFKPYAEKVMKWSTHDAWKNVPIDKIFYAAAGKDLMKIGAKRSKQADQEARKGRTGGAGGENDSSPKSWANAPLEDVGKEIENIKLGKR